MKKYYITIIAVGIFVWSRFWLYEQIPQVKGQEALSDYLANELMSVNYDLNIIETSEFKKQEDGKIKALIKIQRYYGKHYDLYLTCEELESGEVEKIKLNKIDKLNYETTLSIDESKEYEYRVDVIGPNHIYSKPEPINIVK